MAQDCPLRAGHSERQGLERFPRAFGTRAQRLIWSAQALRAVERGGGVDERFTRGTAAWEGPLQVRVDIRSWLG